MNECVLDMVELSSDTLFLELVFLCPNILQASIKVIFELYKVILKPFFLKKKKNVGTLLIHPVLGKME